MEKKNYTYLTKSGIMKIVENPNTALETIGENNIIECKYGYPVVNGKQIIVYGPDKMKLEANREKLIQFQHLQNFIISTKNKAA